MRKANNVIVTEEDRLFIGKVTTCTCSKSGAEYLEKILKNGDKLYTFTATQNGIKKIHTRIETPKGEVVLDTEETETYQPKSNNSPIVKTMFQLTSYHGERTPTKPRQKITEIDDMKA